MEEFSKCIRTSLEYQILDSIRVRLNLSKKRMKAPLFEVRDNGTYLRHCRLLVRTRDFEQFEMPYYMYLGLDLEKSIIEVYTNGAFFVRKKTRYKRCDDNAVFAVASLHEQESLTGRALKELVMSALRMALISGNHVCVKKPLYRVSVTTFSSGPYILTAEK
jgi:hypothetical protein